MIHQLLTVAFLMIIATMGSCQPVDLGSGGIYNSYQANIYWGRRFGFNIEEFFHNLISMQSEMQTHTTDMLNTARNVILETMLDPIIV